MIMNTLDEMPIRSFSGFTGGLFSEMSINGLVGLLNKQKGSGKKFWGGFKKKNR
jgi:hypothetical protein